jgi:hypothetical protein
MEAEVLVDGAMSKFELSMVDQDRLDLLLKSYILLKWNPLVGTRTDAY